jgi:hypothetical protein
MAPYYRKNTSKQGKPAGFPKRDGAQDKKHSTAPKPQPKNKGKYENELCTNEMTFEDCELAILRKVVDLETEEEGQNMVNNPDIQKMIHMLEVWLRKKGNMCYGGTALNAVLPKHAQFYNHDVEIPDYDFFSPHALKDAVELSQYYHRAGFEMIEAKSGVHHGTYKVFVNSIPLADITQLEPVLYKNMKDDSITIGGICYAPIHFLRMACFTELSRPKGDVSRWEKVFKRLTLLNQYYPLKSTIPCELVEFQRPMASSSVIDSVVDSPSMKRSMSRVEKNEVVEVTQQHIYEWLRDALIEQDAVFFGGYATSAYAKYMPAEKRAWVKQIPDFDVLCTDAELCAQKVVEALKSKGVTGCSMEEHEAIGEIVPRHYQITVLEKETVCFLFEPIACHSYNKVKFEGKHVNIATIDTMLSLYLAFIYTGKPYFYKERILCMAQYLFEVEQANRLAQKGVLRRFSMKCVGKQDTLVDIRELKARKFHELKRGTADYNEWFLKYNPATDKPPLIEKVNTGNSKEKHTVTQRKKTPKEGESKTESSENAVVHPKKSHNKRKTRKLNKTKRHIFFY